jgi:signal transduction histidine kinase/ActR/RegA family two-component response regulator
MDHTYEEQASQLREAQRIAGIGSWEWSAAGDTIQWSEGMFWILRRDVSLGAPAFQDLFRFYTPESWERLGEGIKNTLESGVSYDLELEMLRDDGTTCWTTTRGEAVRGPGNAVVKLRGAVQDITQQKAIVQERVLMKVEQEARSAAEKANRAKDEFLAMLSHELRTPLTTILSWSQLLRMGKADADMTRRGLEILERSAKAQAQMIDDLLDISRIQSGKLNLLIQEVDLRKVLAAAVDSTRNLAASRSIQIEAHIDATIDVVHADPMRLQQILWNLITNAAKFSHPGGTVWVIADRIGDRIRIQVRDDGKGIAPAFLPLIFERFTQVDSSSTRAYGGLGLGLAIVRNLVELHEGTVSVDSLGEGKGATFTVSLPVNPASSIGAPETGTEAESETEPGHDGVLRDLRILVVEDEASARDIFQIMLQSFGADVRVAESADQALKTFQEFKPDILVSDIAMPVEDGYSLIGKIRKLDSALAKTPALALTAYASREDVQRAYAAGFQSHMAKPVDANKLAATLAKLAGRRENGVKEFVNQAQFPTH